MAATVGIAEARLMMKLRLRRHQPSVRERVYADEGSRWESLVDVRSKSEIYSVDRGPERRSHGFSRISITSVETTALDVARTSLPVPAHSGT